MAERPIEDLERELRERAFALDAELMVSIDPDGRIKAAFKQFVHPTAPQGVVLKEASAGDKRLALESLLLLARGDV